MGGQGVVVGIVFVEQEVVRFIHRAVGVIEETARFGGFDLHSHFLELLHHGITGAWFAEVVRRQNDHACSLLVVVIRMARELQMQ
jgi:hypothetical protein